MMKKANNAVVLHYEFWPHPDDLAFRKEGSPTGTSQSACKDCGEILSWRCPPKFCRCCKATVCTKHSRQAEMHAAKGQVVCGLMTLCTYCVGILKVPGRTILTDSNTYANVRSVPTALSKKAPQSATRAGGHRQRHKSSWPDCSSLLGFAKRSHPPPSLGPPLPTPTPPPAGEGGAPFLWFSGGGGGGTHGGVAGDGRGWEVELEAGAAAREVVQQPDVRVRRCSHQKNVSWGEDLIHLFLDSEREKAGGDQVWVGGGEESVGSTNRRGRGGVTGTVPRTALRTVLTSDFDKDGDGNGDGNGDHASSWPTEESSQRTKKSTTNNPFEESWTAGDGNDNFEPSPRRSTNPFDPPAWEEEDISSSSSGSEPMLGTGSAIFPVRPRKEGWDGWSSPPPETRPAVVVSASEGANHTGSSAGNAGSTAVTEAGQGEGEGEEKPRSSNKFGFIGSLPKVAGAMAVIGVAATVGVMVLRRRR